MDSISIAVLPALGATAGRGRLIHPTLGTLDYPNAPDLWRNVDTDVIVAPVWANAKHAPRLHLTRFGKGNIRDVEVGGMVDARPQYLGGVFPLATHGVLAVTAGSGHRPAAGRVVAELCDGARLSGRDKRTSRSGTKGKQQGVVSLSPTLPWCADGSDGQGHHHHADTRARRRNVDYRFSPMGKRFAAHRASDPPSGPHPLPISSPARRAMILIYRNSRHR